MPMKCGQLEILPELNEIAGPAGRQRLEPQAVTVLELLAGEPGRLWSREELLDSAWSGRVVSDGTLTGVISRLRRALCDAGVTDIRIETRSKRGYVLTPSKPANLEGRRIAFPLRAVVAAALVAVVALLAAETRLFPAELESLDGVRLAFDITFPDGGKAEPVILLTDGRDGEIRLDGNHPLSLRIAPQVTGDGLLRLRVEASGVSHWTGFEQVIGLGTESRFRLKADKPEAMYDIRFVASLDALQSSPQQIRR